MSSFLEFLSLLIIVVVDLCLCHITHNGNCLITKRYLKDTVRQYQNNYYLPNENCDHVSMRNGLIINPYIEQLKHLTHPSENKSVCFQCVTCLAIAQQMDNTVKSVQISLKSPEDEVKQIRDAVTNMCKTDFKQLVLVFINDILDKFYRFDLKNYGNCGAVINTMGSNIHFSAALHKKWPLTLEETCFKYIDNIKFNFIYNKLLSNSLNLENYLCRGDVLFRSCKNIIFNKIIIQENDLQDSFIV